MNYTSKLAEDIEKEAKMVSDAYISCLFGSYTYNYLVYRYREAASIYKSVQEYLRAGECYFKAAESANKCRYRNKKELLEFNLQRALECYELSYETTGVTNGSKREKIILGLITVFIENEDFSRAGAMAFKLGDLYSQSGQYPKAIDAYTKSSDFFYTEKNFEAMSIARFYTTQCYMILKKTTEAQNIFRKSIAIFKQNSYTSTIKAYIVISYWIHLLTNGREEAKKLLNEYKDGLLDFRIKEIDEFIEQVDENYDTKDKSGIQDVLVCLLELYREDFIKNYVKVILELM